MKSLNDIISTQYGEQLQDVQDWMAQEYDSVFSEYFHEQQQLYNRLKSKVRPITDEEIEIILVQIPLQLFAVSEVINSYRARLEVMKLECKRKEVQFAKDSQENTDTKRKESAQLVTTDDKILISVYSAIITRVENEVSFSRELIMSAKKIWDSRKRAESASPISPVDVDALPAYNG